MISVVALSGSTACGWKGCPSLRTILARRGTRRPGGHARSVPQIPHGWTSAPVRHASHPAPTSGTPKPIAGARVPSGKTRSAPPECRTARAPRTAARSTTPRVTGKQLERVSTNRMTGLLNSSTLVMAWITRGKKPTKTRGSRLLRWLQHTSSGPVPRTPSNPSRLGPSIARARTTTRHAHWIPRSVGPARWSSRTPEGSRRRGRSLTRRPPRDRQPAPAPLGVRDSAPPPRHPFQESSATSTRLLGPPKDAVSTCDRREPT